MKITISEFLYSGIAAFAEQYYDAKQGRSSKDNGDMDNRARRIEQTIMGKLAEEAICELWDTSFPDYTIYPRGTKMSGQPDLVLGPIGVHVKACSTHRRDWMAYPDGDNIVFDPQATDLVVFCQVDIPTRTVEVFGFSMATDLVGKWFQASRPDMQDAGKVAIYWALIQKLKTTTIYLKEEDDED